MKLLFCAGLSNYGTANVMPVRASCFLCWH